jgi:geranylgeranyl reductase
MTLRVEVLIVGGGPAGSAAAKFLARSGVDTLLVERNFSFVKPCGGGVPSFLFSEMDIPADSVRRSIDTIKAVSPRGNVLDIKLEGASIDIVERGSFDRSLRAEAEKCGAKLLEAEFSRFSDIGKTMTAEVTVQHPELKNSPRLAGIISSHTVNVTADYVIAADGVNSRVRAALDVKPMPSFLTLSEKIKEESADVCEFWFGASHAPRCYSWVFPQSEGVSAGTGSFDHRGINNLWKKFVERRRLSTNGSVRGYKIPLWQGDLYNRGRIFFVGDAAGQVMPLTFEGIYYSMKSGEMAAMAIAEGKSGEYKRQWQKTFGRRFALMKRLWAYFMKGDHRVEKIFELHKRPDVLRASMGIWLRKDLQKGSLLSYINIFRRFLG